MTRREALTLSLMVVPIAAILSSPALATNDLSLNVSPSSECVSTGETITVTLNVANLGGVLINGVQVRLHYDNTIMTLVDIVPEIVVAGGWDEVSQSDTNGDVDWAAVINGGSISTAHVIATMTFTAIADGTASVTFRADNPPFVTKLTKASDNTAVSPLTTHDTTADFNADGVGDAFIGPPDCTITADDAVCDGTAGHVASVPDAGAGATYLWSIAGGTITSPTNGTSITYTAGAGPNLTLDVTVTDGNGCVSSCQKVIVVNTNPDCTISAADSVCASSSGNPASVPDAGAGAVYSWSIAGGTIDSGGTTTSISFSAFSGPNVTLDVDVTDGNGCLSSCQKVIAVAAPDCTITAEDEVCDGTTGHLASVIDAGGGATYSWTVTGGTITSATDGTTITYDAGAGPTLTIEVMVTNGGACQSTCQKIVTVNANPVADAGADIVLCADAADPSVGGSPTATGGTSPYTYSWTGTAAAFLSDTAAANPTFDVATAGPGTYTACVVVTDSNTCSSAQDCADITINALPVADAGPDIVLCADAADPSVGGAPTASGGLSPYTYSWTGTAAAFLSDTAAANPTFDVATAGPGTYTACVVVTDSNTCNGVQDCADITIDALPVADAGADIVLCADAADPSVGGASTASGGLGPYTYSWTGTAAAFLSDTAAANPTFDVATAGPGTYTACVVVTDSNTCNSVQDCADITIDALPVADAGPDIVLCADAADPSVGGTPTASGGLSPYTYAWTGTAAAFLSDTAAANPTFDVATAGPGTYTACVDVTDSNTCSSAQDCADITINALPVADAGADFALCANAPDPTVGGSPTASGGLTPYTYAWTGSGAIYLSSTTAANPTFDVATAGVGSFDVCVTVTDSNTCVSSTDCATITVNLVLDCTITTADPVCAGTSNVASVANAGGGATYDWTVSGGTQDTPDDFDTITYTAGAGPTVTIDIVVTDINSCTNTCQTVVTVNDNPNADAGADIVLCADAADPSVGGASTASGGLGPYTYSWTGTAAAFLSDTAAANPTFDVATAGPGTYTACVVVTDSNTCNSVQDCADITIDALPVADAGADIVLCADAADPSVGGAPTASGGLSPYTYAWTGTAAAFLSDTAAANPTFDVATAGPGTYTACVVVTDSNICSSAQDCADITVNALPDCTITAPSLVCEGSTGHAASAPAGAVDYSWAISGGTIDSGQGTDTISFSAGSAGTLTLDVTVTDANGCISTCQKLITVDAPDCTISSDDAVCFQSTGNLAQAPAGASSYVWTVTGGSLTSQIGNSITYAAGSGTQLTLEVEVTNSNGCVRTCQKVVTIIQPSLDVTLELEGITNAVTRDVTFTITECGGSVDTRTVPVTTDASGVGSVIIDNVSSTADWVAVQEGHTLSRLASVVYGSCFVATVDLTTVGSGSPLLTGDLHTGVVSQDNLVDVTDFSILASRWNQAISANASDGADVTGDGLQAMADFTTMQVNFFTVGEAADGCGALVVSDNDGLTPIVNVMPVPLVPVERKPRISASVEELAFPGAELADMDGSGRVDATDIRLFARLHGLPLLPEFARKLDKLEMRKLRPVRGR